MRTNGGGGRSWVSPCGRSRHHGPPEEAPGASYRKRKAECESSSGHFDGGRRGTKRRKARRGHETRPWVFSSRDFSSCKDRFVIVSYNILGVENASKHPDLYQHVKPKNLDWDRRKGRIRRELMRYNPSILCFQEVDRFDDLSNLLHEDGFVGVHKGRTGEANDGCAIFWREEQFTLLHQADIEFQEFGLRNNVAQLCVLKMLHNHLYTSTCAKSGVQAVGIQCDRTLLVGNIHVLFNPNRGDIKLGQMRLLLEKAHEISEEWGKTPIVIAGDLNSIPQSALYQFISSSELDILTYDRRAISGQLEYSSKQRILNIWSESHGRYPLHMSNVLKYKWNEEELLLACGNRRQNHLQHPLKLWSAYAGVPGNHATREENGEPLVTSYHSKFMGTVDYIWHSAELVPVGVVDTMPINTLQKIGCLPSEGWGSDHLSLVCELAFLNDNDTTERSLCTNKR
uniref:Carbon catabolite repressor protein 4 5 n=2 Tax=Anthurium amnicola TaxID=1678845 RepID=A0A1D1Y351_9ARAE